MEYGMEPSCRWGIFSVYVLWIMLVSLQLFRIELMDYGVPGAVIDVAVGRGRRVWVFLSLWHPADISYSHTLKPAGFPKSCS